MIRKIALGVLALGLMAGPAMAQGYNTGTTATPTAVVSSTTVAVSEGSTQVTTATVSIVGGAISSGLGTIGGGTVGGGGPIISPGASLNSGSNMAMHSRDSGRNAGSADKKFGAWMQGGYTSIDNSQTGLQYDGSAYAMVAGLDYALSDRALVGVALSYESGDITTSFNAGTVENTGYSIIPYVGFALNNTWSVDASAGYSWLSYDTTRGNGVVRGSFDAERWFLSANLNGNYAMGRWRLMPKIGVLYLEQDGDSYQETGAGAFLVPTSHSKLGRLYAGGRVGYAFESVMPYVKLVGEYDFEKNAPVSLGNGQFSNDDDFGAQLGLGFDFYGKGPVSGNIEAAYLSAGRSDLDVWTATARLRVKF